VRARALWVAAPVLKGTSEFCLVDHQFARYDRACAGQFALIGGDAHEQKNSDIDGQFLHARGLCPGQGLP